jgi:hypothetical protein
VGGASWENNLPHTPPEGSLSRAAIKENKIFFLIFFFVWEKKIVLQMGISP